MMVRTPLPPPRALGRELPQLGAQDRVIRGRLGLVSLRRAMLANHPAGPAFADAETVA
jgi:hypothetical protein